MLFTGYVVVYRHLGICLAYVFFLSNEQVETNTSVHFFGSSVNY